MQRKRCIRPSFTNNQLEKNAEQGAERKRSDMWMQSERKFAC